MLFYLSLSILILTMGAQIILRFFCSGDRFKITNNIRIYKYLFLFSTILIFSLLFYQSYLQYSAWSQNELSKLILPPYQPLNYFLFYVAMRFFGPYLISLIFALLFIGAAKYLNKKYEERFFYKEEFYLAALSIFLTSYPLAIFYLIAVILIYLLAHFIFIGARGNFKERLSTYYLWLPIAIFAIIIIERLKILEWWKILKL